MRIQPQPVHHPIVKYKIKIKIKSKLKMESNMSQTLTFNQSFMVEWFANIPRYKSNLRIWQNSSLTNGTLYEESILVYVSMSVLVWIIALIALLLYWFCTACFFHRKHSTAKRSQTCRWIIPVVTILVIIPLVIGFVTELKLNKGTDDICQTIQTIQDRFDTIEKKSGRWWFVVAIITCEKLTVCLSFADKIIDHVNLTNQFSHIEDELKQSINVFNISAEIKIQLNKFNEYLQEIKEKMSDTIKTIQMKIKKNNLQEVLEKLESVEDNCSKTINGIEWTNEAMAIIMISSLGLFYFGLCFYCFRILSCGWGLLVWSVIVAFGAGSFLSLIIASNVCHDPKVAVNKYIDTPVTSYYLDCLPYDHQTNNISNVNQIDHLFELVKLDLLQSQTVAKQFENESNKTFEIWCQQPSDTSLIDVCHHLSIIDNMISGKHEIKNQSSSSILNKLTNGMKTVSEVTQLVDCKRMKPQIEKTLATICTTIFESFVQYLLASLFAAIWYYLLLMISIYFIRKDQAARMKLNGSKETIETELSNRHDYILTSNGTNQRFNKTTAL